MSIHLGDSGSSAGRQRGGDHQQTSVGNDGGGRKTEELAVGKELDTMRATMACSRNARDEPDSCVPRREDKNTLQIKKFRPGNSRNEKNGHLKDKEGGKVES